MVKRNDKVSNETALCCGIGGSGTAVAVAVSVAVVSDTLSCGRGRFLEDSWSRADTSFSSSFGMAIDSMVKDNGGSS
mgnify:CR=1 FL=1